MQLHIFILLGYMLLPLMVNAQDQKPLDLSDYQWENRLLLIFSPSRENGRYYQQLKELEAKKTGLEDRDMKIFHLFVSDGSFVGDRPILAEEAESLREKYEVIPHEFTVILIGKDGTEKLRQGSVLQVEKLFAVIDAMPMRQREMRERE